MRGEHDQRELDYVEWIKSSDNLADDLIILATYQTLVNLIDMGVLETRVEQ